MPQESLVPVAAPIDAPSKMVFSMSTVRLTCTKGQTAIVQAGVPKRIPRALFLEAAKAGCVDYDPRMIAALQAAVAAAEVAGEDGADDAPDFLSLAKDAVRQVLLSAIEEPTLLTANGTPRVAAVRAAFELACENSGITTEFEINKELVESLSKEVLEAENAAELNTATLGEKDLRAIGDSRYSGTMNQDPPPGGDLEGEEVGGDVGELLDRVAEAED